MGQTAVDIVLAVSEQWEFLPALALAIMAVWGRTRWSRAAVLAFCAAMAAAFTVAGVVTALNDWATRVLFMPLMTVMIPFYWRLSGLTFARSLFIASTCCVPMILCIDVTLAVDGLMPQYQHMSGFIALPGLTTQWVLSLALIAACRRPMRALPRIVDSPVLSGRMWWVAWLLPFGAASVLSLFNATREEMLSRPDGTVLYTGLVVLIITMLALMYWLLWLVVVRSEHALVVVEENRTLAMRRMWSDHLNERIAAASRTRHDLRQHLLAIRAFVRSGDMAGLDRYLDSLDAAVGPGSRVRYCDHPLANAIIVYYADQAHGLGADADVEAEIPSRIALADADLTVVLGNLLENAVEALRRCVEMRAASRTEGAVRGKRDDGGSPPPRPRLSVKAHATASGPLFLAVRNDYAGPAPELDGPEVVSTKHDGAGWGLQSVRMLAESRGGRLHADVDEEAHGVTVEAVLPPSGTTDIGAEGRRVP